MMKKDNLLTLYLKVFCILLIIGFILPNLVIFLVDKVIILNDQVPLGNSVYVMYNQELEKSWYEVLEGLLKRIVFF
jgi:hypothetical protein